jgi:predicted PurR-regulated permease PerM
MDRIERLAHFAVIVIGVVALFTALNAVESVFAPLALALVAGVVLSPVSDFGDRLGLPPVVGALVSLFLTLLILAVLAAALQPIIARMMEEAPKIWSDMQDTLAFFQQMLAGFSDLKDDVSAALAPQAQAAEAEPGMALPSVTDALLLAPAVAAQLLIFAGALFFFLMTRQDIYDWAARRLSEPTERAQTARRLRDAERLVSRYFLTITVINIGLGIMTAAVLQLLGLPGAALWGLVACLLNFVLYLGPALVAVALVFAGVAAFDGGYSLLPAAAFVTLNALEGQFVTPALVGRHTEVNPLLVFLALVFGIWLWGPIGGIVAIPLLLWVIQLNTVASPVRAAKPA